MGPSFLHSEIPRGLAGIALHRNQVSILSAQMIWWLRCSWTDTMELRSVFNESRGDFLVCLVAMRVSGVGEEYQPETCR